VATDCEGGERWVGFCPIGRLAVGLGVGFPVCWLPGDPGFDPSRFGGTGFFSGAAALGEGPGETFACGEVGPGFEKLGGVFWPGPRFEEPGATSDSVAPFLPICGFTKGAGLGRPPGWGFCSAMVFLSFSAFWGFMPCHPFSTLALTIRFCTDGTCAACALRIVGGAMTFS
jgi:hypothetical protein